MQKFIQIFGQAAAVWKGNHTFSGTFEHIGNQSCSVRPSTKDRRRIDSGKMRDVSVCQGIRSLFHEYLPGSLQHSLPDFSTASTGSFFYCVE